LTIKSVFATFEKLTNFLKEVKMEYTTDIIAKARKINPAIADLMQQNYDQMQEIKFLKGQRDFAVKRYNRLQNEYSSYDAIAEELEKEMV